ncbi:FCD domain-containing protein [Burkholderia ubonensis]|uniref:FCD domain-containing protein n=2 Tax=Burkholderia ubonensis TaxID=101571 RepID=UPI000AA0F78B|nr:FCD domain-containing protein [Burkholderia ubonensis]
MGDAIYRSVKRLDDETLARAELVHRLLGDSSVPRRQGEPNREFHALLYSCCGNARQLKAITELRSQVERYERLQATLLADTPSFQVEHEDILQACRERNARAARAMTVAHRDATRRRRITPARVSHAHRPTCRTMLLRAHPDTKLVAERRHTGDLLRGIDRQRNLHVVRDAT